MRFAVVGVINTSIDLAVFYLAFYWLGLHLIVANTIAYSVGTVNSYLMNKYWTFAGRGSPEVSPAEFSRFILFNLGGLILSNIAIFIFAKFVPPIISKIGAIGITFIWNYVTIRRFVFRDTATIKSEQL